MSAGDPLALFSAPTRQWFASAFTAPTAAQVQAWSSIGAGRNALVIAPTGSGKTLAAFLWAIDRLTSSAPSLPEHRCRVLYVSPLKALAFDIERNLRLPLAGLERAARELHEEIPEITIATRTGDTPASERRAFARQPADILITTPESLFLILTSQARRSLRGVETVIVDEVHSLCSNKRGAHLAVSLERLDALLPRPAQRIGLSATVRPAHEAARFLGGAHPVDIVAPATPKQVEITVEVPVPDLGDLPIVDTAHDGVRSRRERSVWPAIEERVLDLVESHRSTIVFANGRRTVERLCARVNELAASRQPEAGLGRSLPWDPDPEHSVSASSRTPSEVMAQSRIATGQPATVARAHHGSVSQSERAETERALKEGTVPVVIATSSLELGIDMGSVDLVIQIETPPSVAAGLQRVGRAGHGVGVVSRAVVLPKHRGDLLTCAVVAERMIAGEIEELHIVGNPLDVLSQHIVAMVGMDDWPLQDLADLVRGAAPFARLPDSALFAVLDMLSGRYPSTAFAHLRPCLVWDRDTNLLTALPRAQRLAVTSGGTIPQRGLFGVFIAEGGSRVGELDEEMVYESRVGDVFLLGSTSWRIEDITRDRVIVSPAPGLPARMPFWHGDAIGRPAELGRAVGERLRALSGPDPDSSQLARCGLDAPAIDNLLGYVSDQRRATGCCPDDQTIVVERFRDELGDWRVVVHSVFGARVNGPWALAISHRVSQRYGVRTHVLPSDDGIVIRLPDLVEPPRASELVLFEPEELTGLVEDGVGGSPLFAARFRECASRALLLPRGDPRRRQPLWQQRHRAAQLLDIARDYPEFPLTLETARECLQEVFDLPSLVELMRGLLGGPVRLIDVETPRPSPFARSLLFGYVGAFLYEGDAPLAERRASALALDPVLLGELLGRVDLGQLLDPEVVAETGRRLQWLAGGECPRGADDVAHMLRVLGDLSEQEVLARGGKAEWLAELAAQGRVIEVTIAGERRWLAVEDASRVRDALAVPLPRGVPAGHLAAVADPVADVVARYARTHGPFTSHQVSARFALGNAVVERALTQLATRQLVVAGSFSPLPEADSCHQWCDAQVLRTLRRESLTALRREIQPVPAPALARFLADWHGIGRDGGIDAVLAAVDRLRGCPVPASILERLVLPARVHDYVPAHLDELCAAGEVVWAGAGRLPGGDGLVVLCPTDLADQLLPVPDPTRLPRGPVPEAVLAALDDGRASHYRALREEVTGLLAEPVTVDELSSAIWDLVWAGAISSDTLAPLRAVLGAAPVPRRGPRSRHRGYLGRRAVVTTPPSVAGRWHRIPLSPADPPGSTARLAATAEALLDRHGVVTRETVASENVPGGFTGVYGVLKAMEERGMVRRGYFVDGLGAAQFGLDTAVDAVRASARDTRGRVIVLAAADPAQPYGATLPWPARTDQSDETTGGRPGRRAGALAVLVGGELALYAERGCRALLTFVDDAGTLDEAVQALACAVRGNAMGSVLVERVNGGPVAASPYEWILRTAGFRSSPRGLRLDPTHDSL